MLYGFSIALMVRSDLGLAPWDVLHSGLTKWFPIDIGQALVLVSFVVMLAWIPLREMPGVGTISNAIVIGLSTDLFLVVLAAPSTFWLRVVLLTAGVVLQGAATAAYIGAQLGRGPRDGLMTGLARRSGRSLRLVRTLMELAVVALGLMLGGVAGIGTIVYALSIGPLSQALLPVLPGPGVRSGRRFRLTTSGVRRHLGRRFGPAQGGPRHEGSADVGRDTTVPHREEARLRAQATHRPGRSDLGLDGLDHRLRMAVRTRRRPSRSPVRRCSSPG